MMVKCLFGIFLLISVDAFSQICSAPADFTSQQEIDDFVANYSTSCNELQTLFIARNNLDFSGLTFITSIDTILFTANYGTSDSNITIQNLQGLDNVTSLNKIIISTYEQKTININSFEGLEGITTLGSIILKGDGGDINISSFQGLQNVTSITDELRIRPQEVLVDQNPVYNLVNGFNGLENIQSIEKLHFENPSNNTTINLNSSNPFQVFNNITSINEIEIINKNISFLGLENVATLTSLDLESSVSSLEGLSGVTQIGSLILQNNNSLTSLGDLSSLTNVATGEITGNTNLNECCIIAPFVSNLTISGNATNCESENTILNTCVQDSDNDGINNDVDNCVNIPNPNQEDTNNNGIGDICETDTDNDGVIDYYDNCINASNPNQEDYDNDGLGNICDNDLDGDGIDNANDNCPYYANPLQEDSNNDGIGDACNNDFDNDNVPNASDNCPTAPNNNQADVNNNGIGDVCEDISGTGTGFFGIGTNNPQSKLHVSNGDIYIDNRHRGIIFKTPDGKCVRLRVTGTGSFNRTIVTCPDE